jgi:hypothetical protein
MEIAVARILGEFEKEYSLPSPRGIYIRPLLFNHNAIHFPLDVTTEVVTGKATQHRLFWHSFMQDSTV